jgi:hypothetical protein
MTSTNPKGFDHQSRSSSSVHSLKGTNHYKTTIAIGLSITTRTMSNITGPNIKKLPFFRSLLKSFCQTTSEQYDYHFFVAYDYVDEYFSDKSFLDDFRETFYEQTRSHCTQNSGYSLHLLMCYYTRKLAWGQNDAMVEAYLSGMEYFYRVNDDTLMKTRNWTERFIDTLETFSPPRIGVVGPNHTGGNTVILTYDFTHRTHLTIHGFYYPREFIDWYGDTWITNVYKPSRSIKLPDILLEHTMELGRRYNNSRMTHTEVNDVIRRDQATIIRYFTLYVHVVL